MAGDNTDILSAFLPQKAGKESNTETTKTDLNPDAMNEIIRQMMEGDSGLASILKGQVGGGLYNSSTSQLLANDLASRVAGKAALASAPTTRSSSRKSTMQGSGGGTDPKYAAGLQLVGMLAEKLFGSGPKGGRGADGSNSKDAKSNNVFDQIFSGILGRDKKGSGQGFNPGEYAGSGGFDLSGMDFGGFGFSGGGGNGSFGGGFGSGWDTGGGRNTGFGNSFDSGFGSGGFDSLSYGLGGGGYNYDPYSLTAGGNYNLGNSFSSGGGGGDFSDWGGLSSRSSSSYQPADYSFNSSNFW